MPVVTPEDIEELSTTSSDPAWDYLNGLQQSLGANPDGQEIAAFRAALAERCAEMFRHIGRHAELGVGGPAIRFLRLGDSSYRVSTAMTLTTSERTNPKDPDHR